MLWICVLLVIFRGTYSGYCTSSYKCYDTCYGRIKYEEKCGLWDWGKCTRYRAYSYSCTSTCYRSVCCLGYEGSYCQNPICSPPCSDGGRCIAPNHCSCRTGFSPPTCSDINECYRSHGCQHSCVNTYGSFYCTCGNGYALKSDYKTCEDINECYTNNGGCQHSCTNTIGSFYCQCRSGYKLNYDGKSCSDVDECYAGTSGCAQTCHNRDGYFTCSCRAGYTLAINGKSCEDVDECSSKTARCQGYCRNTIGSYTCYCGSGYVIGSDGFTCQDIDECSNGNGKCSQKCINLPGTYSCECFRGYRMDGDICKDIDECKDFTSGCSQLCNNTIGSFTCGCQRGYFLSEDKKTCKDVDDCEGVTCLHGGKCIDGSDKYTCSCESGYTDIHCQTDINECDIVNGGCYDVCINTDGGFYCNCSEGGILQPDGFSCKSDANEGLTVFERNKLPRQLLPKGCFIIMLTKCTDGNDIKVYLFSTSEWYTLNSDTSVVFSLGIIFVKVNSLSVPVSIRGLEVKLGGRQFEMHYGVQYSANDGTAIVNDLTPRNCRPFELGKGDIFDLIGADSFIKTMLLSIYPSLPDWLRFQNTKGEILAVQDLKSELVYGEDIDDIAWCSGAPVHSNHLYTVFRFGSGFQLRVLEKDINMPKPLNSKKFCLIVDLCQNNGGTVFLMIPEESRELLTGIDVFSNLKEQHNLLILPRGIGVSLQNGIFINKQPLSFELWNGDKMFQPLIPKLDLWIGGDVVKNDPFFKIAGEADIFVGIPSVQTIFTSMFREEWTGLVDIAISASPELRFKIFGREYLITFKLVTAVLDIYFSMGGSNRIFCGDVSNPPGLFASALVDINPFKGVPILEDWIFYSEHRFYIFFDSEAFGSSSNNLDISVLDEVLKIDSLLVKLVTIIDSSAGEIESQLLSSSDDAIFVFRDTVVALKKLKKIDLYDIRSGNLNDKIVVLNRIRDNFLQLERIASNFIDKVEFIANSAIQNLTDSINMFMDSMKINIQNAMQKLTSTITNSVGSYKGFGFKYTTDLRIFKLVMGGMNLELVYSDGNLFQCSRFDKIRDFLKGERALAFFGSSYREISLGRFLSYRVGSGVGGAFATDSFKVVLQLHASISFIGIRTTGDIFITTNGLYFYVEGNVWDIFLAQINVSAETGKEWYQLTFRLSGRLVANARKKRELGTKVSTSNSYIKALMNSKKIRRTSSQERQTYVNVIARRKRQVQRVNNSFQSSYLDGLKKVISFIGEEANRRLTQVQNAFTFAQKGLYTAKIVLDDAKKSLTSANIHFDNAVVDRERAKQKIEVAKGPYNEAIRRLEEAKIYINNLCIIRVCPKVCIPGIKCNICFEYILGLRIPYPCCKLTSCMISIPDPLCVLANIACGIIRALAYVALESAKLVVNVVLVAFDIAQAALTLTQFIVDNSRVVLQIAEGVIEIAKFGLDVADGVLFAAKVALEGVKFVIGFAVKVMELIIEYGLKSIVDVRNCGFEIELSTKDLPIFDVYCEVNVFRLGWTKINIGINFKNILQSIWQAARATINAFMQLYEGIVDRRKRRDLTFEASSKMHVLFRSIRESGLTNETEMNWNDTINITEDILGFSGSNVSATENMIQIFKEKCRMILKIQKFMHDAFSSMENVLAVSKANLDKISMIKQKLQELNNTGTDSNVTIESMGISKEYAFADYNMTEDDLNRAMIDTKTAAANDPLIAKIKSAANSSLEIVDAERESVGVFGLQL